MTLRLVVEQRHQFSGYPPVNGAVIREEQPNLSIILPAQRPNAALFRPENRVEPREREVNNAMQLEIYKQIRLQGKLIQAAEDSHALLLSQNKELRRHIVERTESLEKEWLGIAEHVSAKVDAFYRTANAFYNQFSAENQEAELIWKSYIDANGDCDKLMQRFQGNYVKAGAATETTLWYDSYSHVVEKPLAAVKQIQLTGRSALNALIRTEIQKIKNEMFSEEPKVIEQGTLSVVIHEGDVLQAFLQEGQEEIKFLEEQNLLLKNENAKWEKKKIEMVNSDKRFWEVFHSYLAPCFQLPNGIKLAIQRHEAGVKLYVTALSNLDQAHSLAAGLYSRAIELDGRFKDHLKKIESLLEALEKKEST